MYFFFKNKKQYLDLTGNLILSHNDQLVKVRTKSAGPTKVLNSKFIINCGLLTIWGKWKATKIALGFIWGKPNPLTAEDTNLNKPDLKVVDIKLCHRHGGTDQSAYCTECTKNAI